MNIIETLTMISSRFDQFAKFDHFAAMQALEAPGELVIPHLTKEIFAATLACTSSGGESGAALSLPAVLEQFPVFRGITVLYVTVAFMELCFGAIRAWCCGCATFCGNDSDCATVAHTTALAWRIPNQWSAWLWHRRLLRRRFLSDWCSLRARRHHHTRGQ